MAITLILVMNYIFIQNRVLMEDQACSNSFEKSHCSSDVKTGLLIPRPPKMHRKARQLTLIVTSRMQYQLRKKMATNSKLKRRKQVGNIWGDTKIVVPLGKIAMCKSSIRRMRLCLSKGR